MTPRTRARVIVARYRVMVALVSAVATEALQSVNGEAIYTGRGTDEIDQMIELRAKAKEVGDAIRGGRIAV